MATGIRYVVRRRKDSLRGSRIRVFVGLVISVTFGLKSLARALDAPFLLDMASMALFGGALLVRVIAENRAVRADKEALFSAAKG